MTPVETFAGIIAVLTPVMLIIFRWMDQRQAAIFRQLDVEHRHRMELSAVTAAAAANASVLEVQSSKQERSKQVGELKEMIKENTDISKTAFKEANGVNLKLESLGIEIAKNTAAAREDHMEVKTVTIEAQTVEVHPEKSAKP